MYDCLFPWTVGGAERWYRALAAELVEAGCEVTYLTRLQWPGSEPPDLPGVRVVAVSSGGELYDAQGRRRSGPPLLFGAGVLRHLLTHRQAYDVVHTNGFPYFSVLGARAALAGRARPVLVVEWVEVWTPEYWRGYLGGVGGRIGELVQRSCVRLSPVALAHSHLHAARLRPAGYRGPEPVVVSGLLDELPAANGDPGAERAPLVVYAGRHIPDKRVHLLPEAVALARQRIPGLRAVLLGDGPERGRVQQAVLDAGAETYVDLPGFVDAEQVEQALAAATCVVQPSSREGHGMVVVEAAARATPSVVVAGPDNAAVELVEDGVTGRIAAAPTAQSLAEAIVAVHQAGPAMRRQVARWYSERRSTLGVAASAQRVLEVYREALARAR